MKFEDAKEVCRAHDIFGSRSSLLNPRRTLPKYIVRSVISVSELSAQKKWPFNIQGQASIQIKETVRNSSFVTNYHVKDYSQYTYKGPEQNTLQTKRKCMTPLCYAVWLMVREINFALQLRPALTCMGILCKFYFFPRRFIAQWLSTSRYFMFYVVHISCVESFNAILQIAQTLVKVTSGFLLLLYSKGQIKYPYIDEFDITFSKLRLVSK